jgi:tRNA (guanine37-N1)-methyltransferase
LEPAVRSLCVEVPPAEGESVRRRLQEAGLLRKDLRIEREKDRLFIPVTERVDLGRPVVEREFKEAFTAVRRYRDVVQVPPRLAPLLPKAFDAIGDIVVFRIPEALKGYEGAIGEAILKWNHKVRTVAVDEGVEGELRIRKVRVVAGEPRTRTEHVEFGLRYLVDVERAYFSPRLGAERHRVAEQVREGEVVVDMFSGVGPYAILIARTRKPKVVHAIDANPAAVEFLRENVRRNRAHTVVVHQGLGQEVLPRLAPADRVIMDLPQGAREFLPGVAACVRYGGAVHFYAIVERGRVEEAREDALKLVRHGRRSAQVLTTRIVRGYSPGRIHLAMDLRII